jgi:hypothetical protein
LVLPKQLLDNDLQLVVRHLLEGNSDFGNLLRVEHVQVRLSHRKVVLASDGYLVQLQRHNPVEDEDLQLLNLVFELLVMRHAHSSCAALRTSLVCVRLV